MNWKDTIAWSLENDILQFAGLAFILFGFLRKIKCSDLMMFLIALGMSVIGSLVRFIDLGDVYANELAGLFIGTVDPILEEETACFPLFNWFIVVVVFYLYAKVLRHCSDTDRFYSIALPMQMMSIPYIHDICEGRDQTGGCIIPSAGVLREYVKQKNNG